MFTMNAKGTRMAVSAAAAVTIVAFGGLVLDQAHIAAAPEGRVEIGELTPVDLTQMAAFTLPEVTVVARRESRSNAILAATELPEIVVTAKRVAHRVAQGKDANPDSGRKALSAAQSAADGALLK